MVEVWKSFWKFFLQLLLNILGRFDFIIFYLTLSAAAQQKIQILHEITHFLDENNIVKVTNELFSLSNIIVVVAVAEMENPTKENFVKPCF